MWDSLKSATALQLPQPLQQQQRQYRGQHRRDGSSVEEIAFDNRINGLGLGITNGPYKFEVRRGKTVPQPLPPPVGAADHRHHQQHHRQLHGASHPLTWTHLLTAGPSSRRSSPPSDSDDLEAPGPPARETAPRNPRQPHAHPHAPGHADAHLDFRPSSPLSVSLYHDDNFPTTSRRKTPSKDMYGRPTAIEISPPSSPELEAARHGAYPENVSPIDEGPDLSQQDLLQHARQVSPPPQESRSHIPTVRHEKQRSQDPKNKILRESRSRDHLQDQPNQAVKHPWERIPGQPVAPEHDQSFGLTTIVTGPQARRTGNPPPPSFGQRMRQLAKGKPEPVESRPPWNGASGRAPLVDPVRDDLAVAPLKLSRKASKRVVRGGASPVSFSGSETSSGAAATVRRLLPSRSSQKLKDAAKAAAQLGSGTHVTAAQPYPSPPYAEPLMSQSLPESEEQPSFSSNAPTRLSPNMINSSDKAIRRKPPPSTHTNVSNHTSHISTSSSVYSSYPDQNIPPYGPRLTTAKSTSPFTAEDPWVQPPSRFSVTTCNTTIPRLSP
ncbi:hypothetical protein G7046_g8074 [Stylonectria norvegica]|nr:hypothetical protein G7046_g8074 [Stylonectria norvegica]